MVVPDTHELAWAAGFFDGEGHTRGKPGANNTKCCELQVGQKTTECLSRLMKAVGGVGTIGGPYHRKYPVYFWYLTRTSDVDKTLTLLWPYLSSAKKNQATCAGFVLGVVRQPKNGRPKRKPHELKPTLCHPNRKHVGNGLCGSCYQIKWKREQHE